MRNGMQTAFTPILVEVMIATRVHDRKDSMKHVYIIQ